MMLAHLALTFHHLALATNHEPPPILNLSSPPCIKDTQGELWLACARPSKKHLTLAARMALDSQRIPVSSSRAMSAGVRRIRIAEQIKPLFQLQASRPHGVLSPRCSSWVRVYRNSKSRPRLFLTSQQGVRDSRSVRSVRFFLRLRISVWGRRRDSAS
ncbi:hypothetical protein FB45DRAFT_930900 [Roridomyces roridus]|uniref:Secreted protein n=1 Tax=Roridomyces roridus TaxID=1738132 RepID=A0AAD7BFL0_9AGAR|nr:hypothetical protein FB45DRAFT_930900 [Roridomyces roridus]